MEDEPRRLLSELRAPQHRPPMMAFVVVAVACAIVIATGLRLDAVGGLVRPWPRQLLGIGAELHTEESTPPAGVLGGSVIEPRAVPPVAPVQVAPGPRQRSEQGAGAAGDQDEHPPVDHGGGDGSGTDQDHPDHPDHPGKAKGQAKGKDKGHGKGRSGDHGHPAHAKDHAKGHGKAKGHGRSR